MPRSIAGDPRPVTAGEAIWAFPREGKAGIAVAHLVNVDYEPASDRVMPQRHVDVTLARSIYARGHTQARLYSYDGEPSNLAVAQSAEGISLRVPELRQRAIIRLIP